MQFEIKNIIVTHNTEMGFRYAIRGWVNDQLCIAYTNNSLAIDYYNDDTEPELQKSAKLICETKLMEAYIDGNY